MPDTYYLSMEASARPHAHKFKAEIMLSSEKLNQIGFVVDLVEVRDKIGRWIDDNWDHVFLANEH